MAKRPNQQPQAPQKGGQKGFNPKSFERPGLTEDEILEIKEAFDLFDTDGYKYYLNFYTAVVPSTPRNLRLL